MANMLPVFSPFVPSSDKWDEYIQRFECFLHANDLADLSGPRKRGYFLSSCGSEVFSTARALAAPQQVFDLTWESLLEKLKDHYSPAPSRIARRRAFRHCVQREGETVNAFMASLRVAALQCEFQDLDDMLLDQLVCGLRDLRLQRRLLAKKDVDLATAIAEARAAEMADDSAAVLQKGSLATDRPLGVHHEETSREDSSTDDVDVRRLNLRQERRRDLPDKRPPTLCVGCGGDHPRGDCRFKTAVCRRCGKRGHLARVCRAALPAYDGAQERTKARKPPGRPLPHQRDCFTVSRFDDEAVSFATTAAPANKIHLTVRLEGAPCDMEVDTGSSRSLIAWSTLKRLLPQLQQECLQPCPVTLRDYQGRMIPTLGVGRFRVAYHKFEGSLPLIVVRSNLPSLLGLDWFAALGLDVIGVHATHLDRMSELASEFADVFGDNLGKYNGTPVSLQLDPQVLPIRLKPRRVPLALRPRVDEQLDKLIAQGVLVPIDHSKWETPIVTPLKPDGSVRICADYKGTINKALQANPYPVPVVQHLLHSLGQGRIFAKLDLAQAYQQLPVDEETALAQTIVTHRGAFKCTRLQFGVCVAPGIFQGLMERLLHGLPGVVPYFDDVLVSGSDMPDLVSKVRAVLTCLRKAGLRLRKDKCQIGVPQVEFLGFLVDANGIHPTPSKVEAIQNAPTPTTKSDLQAFLGLLNFYAIFLPHKATVAEPLHRLLDAGAPWKWTQTEAASFEAVKRLLTSSAVLVQYDEKLPLSLTCDASPYGVGAVLSHLLPNGSEAPIAFYSRTLSPAERNYSQLDREALAIVAGIKRFHNYLYGRFFSLVTDHKPLLGLLASDRPTPQILSPRMSRWTEFLAAYSYQLIHKPGKEIRHADALSRCPLPTSLEDPAPSLPVLLIEEANSPITALDICRESAKDPILAQILDWTRRGWPRGPIGPEFLPYARRQCELSVQKGCLLWGNRVVVPPALRTPVLECLHMAHPGIGRMKALGRGYVWWPKLDHDIETWVGLCQLCQGSRATPPAAPTLDWETPRGPWARIHLDLAGPFMGQTFLVVVDAYSKWVELFLMQSTTSDAVVRVLDKLFTTFGLPDVLVTDNGPQFTSASFLQFLALRGIRHAPTAPFHPAANGRAERAVRSAKEALGRLGTSNWQQKVNRYLLAQHTTPCPISKVSPAELLMGRRLRTVLDRLHPTYMPEKPQEPRSGARAFVNGDPIFAQNFEGRTKWLPGYVIQLTGPYSYRVQLTDGRIWRRHINQLRRREIGDANQQQQLQLPAQTDEVPQIELPTAQASLTPNPCDCPKLPANCPSPRNTGAFSAADIPDNPSVPVPKSPAPPPSTPPPVVLQSLPPAPPLNAPTSGLRRSGRSRRRPAYLADYACAVRGLRGVKSSPLRPVCRSQDRENVLIGCGAGNKKSGKWEARLLVPP